jgi:hypothetical protein
MQRILLACNAILALLLAIRLAQTGAPVLAANSSAAWSAADLQVEPIVEGHGARAVRELLVDLGADVGPAAAAADPVDLGLRLDPMGGGTCYWNSLRTVRLVAPDWLAPARRYRVVLERPLVALDGRRLAAGVIREFSTPGARLQHAAIDDTDDRAERDALAGGLRSADRAVAGAATTARRRRRRSGASCRPASARRPGSRRVGVPARTGGALPPGRSDRRQCWCREAANWRARLTRCVASTRDPLAIESLLAAADGLPLRCNRNLPLPAAGLRVEPPVPFQLRRSTGPAPARRVPAGQRGHRRTRGRLRASVARGSRRRAAAC